MCLDIVQITYVLFVNRNFAITGENPLPSYGFKWAKTDFFFRSFNAHQKIHPVRSPVDIPTLAL